MFDEVAAGISSSAAGDIFEMGSSHRSLIRRGDLVLHAGRI
jgi:hypothetical protein